MYSIVTVQCAEVVCTACRRLVLCRKSCWEANGQASASTFSRGCSGWTASH